MEQNHRINDEEKYEKIKLNKSNISIKNDSTFVSDVVEFYQPEKLFNTEEKEKIMKRKAKLLVQVDLLQKKLKQLKNEKIEIQNNIVPQCELFLTKYQVIDKVYDENIHPYLNLLNNYFSIFKDKEKLILDIQELDVRIKMETELKNSLINEQKQYDEAINFESFDEYISFPTLSQSKIIKNCPSTLDYISKSIHEQITWLKNRLQAVNVEITEIDNNLYKYSQKTEKNATLSITSDYNIANCRDELIFDNKKLRYQVEWLQQKAFESDNYIRELSEEVESLRCKKLKNKLEFSNTKTKLRAMHKANLGNFQDEITKYKNEIRQIKRDINNKADEYNALSKYLLDLFHDYEKAVDSNKENVFKIVYSKNPQIEPDLNNKQTNDEEESESEYEEEVIEVYVDDTCGRKFIEQLEKNKAQQIEDIQKLRKQLNMIKINYRNKIKNLNHTINFLNYRDQKLKDKISRELTKLQNIKVNASIEKSFNKVLTSITSAHKLLAQSQNM